MSAKQRTAVILAIAVSLVVAGCGNSRACTRCNGTGSVNVVDSWSGQWATVSCPQCAGTGKITGQDEDSFAGPFGWIYGQLRSWGVPGGIAIVAVVALMIYLDSSRNRDLEEEKRKEEQGKND